MAPTNGSAPDTAETVSEGRGIGSGQEPSSNSQPTHETQTRSWRDVVRIHPAADLFPLLSREQLIELGEDIKKNGVQEPVRLIELDGDELLLDGRNRLDAMEAVGLPVI